MLYKSVQIQEAATGQMGTEFGKEKAKGVNVDKSPTADT
jgi:hypothetical protein